jgi:hypothetical protein
MIRGLALEPAARASYCAARKVTVQPTCVQNRARPWMRASLDGLNARERLVMEMKCGRGCYKRTAFGRAVPDCYYGQLQHILAVLEYASIDFWCYSPGKRAIHLQVSRDERYIGRLPPGRRSSGIRSARQQGESSSGLDPGSRNTAGRVPAVRVPEFRLSPE